MNNQANGLRRIQTSSKLGFGSCTATIGRLFVIAIFGCFIINIFGCASSGEADTSGKSVVSAASMKDVRSASNSQNFYMVDRDTAHDLGYRIDWQRNTHPSENSGIKDISVQGDSVFVLDGQNFLARLRRSDGVQLWRIPVVDAIDEIQGIKFMPTIRRIYVTSGGDMIVLESDTGSQIAKQKLGEIANTKSSIYGPYFIYGARNGQLVWHTYSVGHEWRAYQVSPSIQLDPQVYDGVIVTVGNNGRVMVLDAGTTQQLWNKRLLNYITARPAVGLGNVYIAGLDQHLWALDIDTGYQAWRYLTRSPLTDSPVIVGERVYQQIPADGLVCFEARPIDSPDGVILWTAESVKGNVIARLKSNLLVWDDDKREMDVIDIAYGSVAKHISIPSAQYVLGSLGGNGDVIAASEDGRVVRLVPRNN